MTEPVTLLIVTVVVATLAIVGLVAGFMRGRRGRGIQSLAVGVGFFGLYLSGLLAVMWQGIKQMVQWLETAVGSTTNLIGLGLVAVGVLGVILAQVAVSRARSRGPAPHPDAPHSGTEPGRSQGGHRTPPPRQQPGVGRGDGPKQADPELDEVEQILRSRGIN
ncbi:hypothetical protein [Propioniferax innocua]|uniref:Uncharacterized protein n=1 Tax=Propioniferax innocua TaxID=1753 RepID=A0A542ZB94_9ACTN|nr:hypothetical protein [Propioniferax innocua]TQL57561.1 hypothetical protein FB460_1394 [Propioniferax innocua]